MSRRIFDGVVVVAVLALGACAAVEPCVPVSVIVAAKDRRARLGTEPGGIRTTETGIVREIQRDTIVAEYWLKDTQGRWDRVSEATWRDAEVGRPAEVCRPRS